MSTPADLLALSPQAARQVYHFIFSPATNAETAQLALHVPRGLDPATPSGARALRLSANLPEPVLDLTRAEHRLALLPREGLGALARFVAVGLLAWPIRWVIRKAEIDRLANGLSAPEWAYALRCSERRVPDPRNDHSGRLDGQDLADQIAQAGWAEIDAASYALAPPIGARLRLKLPVGSAHRSSAQTATQSLDRILDAYEPAVLAWRPDWDTQFTRRPVTRH